VQAVRIRVKTMHRARGHKNRHRAVVALARERADLSLQLAA